MIFTAFVENLFKIEGITFHNWIGRLMENRLQSEGSLYAWIKDEFLYDADSAVKKISLYDKNFDHARYEADRMMMDGIWICRWENNSVWSVNYSCPKIFFGKGELIPDISWMGFFNSRKPRLILPNDSWISALRDFLSGTIAGNIGFASSWGTPIYDMITVFAQARQIPLLLILPFALEDLKKTKPYPLTVDFRLPVMMLSCQFRGIRCPKQTRLVCRDRMLAFMSDSHFILEIRSNGNLFNILNVAQSVDPRQQILVIPEKKTIHNKGNFDLHEKFSSWIKPYVVKNSNMQTHYSTNAGDIKILQQAEISWKDYLYHYTRSCPGPWLGQGYEDYLMELVQNHPLSGHRAIDTLVRILCEGKIRAGFKLIKGKHRVISWTSRPPYDLMELRRWNPALIRWTFEPYGIAIKRKIIRNRCLPVIYTREYQRLRASDRFRFQLHDPPRCSWKYEREWRMCNDLSLKEINSEDGFIFINHSEELNYIIHIKELKFPVLIF